MLFPMTKTAVPNSFLLAEVMPISRAVAGSDVHIVTRRRIAALDWAALTQQIQSKQPESQLTVALFHDLVYTFDTGYVEPSAEGTVYWQGAVPGLPDLQCHLAVSGLDGGDRAVSGVVQAGTSQYILSSLVDGQVEVREVLPGEQAAGFDCVCQANQYAAYTSVPDPAQRAAIEQEYQAAQVAFESGAQAIIRVVMLYPPKTQERAGGEAALKAKVMLAQGLANLAFSGSKINARIEVVLQEEKAIKVDEKDIGVRDILKQVVLKENVDPHLVQRVVAHLATHNADVAALLIPESKAGSGITFAVPSPPSVVNVPLAHRVLALSLYTRQADGSLKEPLTTRNTLVHELGHLLGADHDRFTQLIRHRDAAYDHVRGYTPDNRVFTTIMGYTNPTYGTTTRVNLFSSPKLTWQGQPLGIPSDQPNAADAASFLRLSTQVMARYKAAPDTRALRTLITGLTPALAGTIELDALGPYVAGTQVKVTAIPRSGDYQFHSWHLDGQPHGTAASFLLKMDTDHVLEAHFDAGHAVHTLTARANLADIKLQVWPALTLPGKYPTGTDVTLSQSLPEDLPVSNYDPYHALLGWKVNGHMAWFEPKLPVRLMADTQIEGVFGKRVHTVRYHSVPDTEVNKLQLYAFADGEAFHFLNTFADGQRLNLTSTGEFEHWRINGKVHKDLPQALTFFIRHDLLLEACFKGWDKAVKLLVTCNIPIQPILSWGSGKDASTLNRQRNHEEFTKNVYYLPKDSPITLEGVYGDENKGDLESVTVNQVYVTLEEAYHFKLDKETVIHFEFKPK